MADFAFTMPCFVLTVCREMNSGHTRFRIGAGTVYINCVRNSQDAPPIPITHSLILRRASIFVYFTLFRCVKMSANLCKAVALVALLSSAAALPQAQFSNSSANSANTQPSTANTQPLTANAQPSTNLCGDNQNVILTGTPWLVANSMYGAGSMVGTSCTYYDHIDSSAGGNPQIVWSNTINIQDVDST